jgi:hypothetical protein
VTARSQVMAQLCRPYETELSEVIWRGQASLILSSWSLVCHMVGHGRKLQQVAEEAEALLRFKATLAADPTVSLRFGSSFLRARRG